MTDFATLGLRVESREVVSGKQALDDLARSSETAERATQGFNRSAAQSSSASRKLASDIRGVETAFGGLKGMIVGVAAAMGASLFAGFSLGKFVSSTSEAEGALAQLNAALRSTGGVSGMTVDSLSEMASELQKASKYGDEAIMSAQGLLLTFTNVGRDVFPRATQAILDMSEAMNQDLKSSALQVGKALNDPVEGVSALTRVGVQFSDSQKKMIESLVASGKGIEAQKLILKELETQFAGSAKAARDTLGGAVAALGNAWGDLFEIAGPAAGALTGAINGLTSAMQNPVFGTFVHTIGAMLFGAATMAVQGLTLIVGILPTIAEYAAVAGGALLLAFSPVVIGGAIAGVSAAIGALGAAFVGLGAIIAANPFTALAVGIAAAATAVYAFRDDINQALGVDVIQIARDVANGMIGLFVGAFQAIKAGVGEIPGAFRSAFASAMNGAVGIVQSGVNAIIGVLNKLPGMSLGAVDLSGAKFDPGAGGDILGAAKGAFAGAQGDYIGGIAGKLREFTTRTQKAFPTATGGRAPGFGGAGGGGGGGGAANDNSPDAFEREIAASEKRNAQLQREIELFGQSNAVKAEAEMRAKLLAAAKEAELPITDSLNQKIDEQANKYRELTARLEEMNKAQQASKDLQQFIGTSISSFFSDIVSGGKNAGDALMNLTKRLADAAIQAALLGQGPLAKIFGTSEGGGLIGTLFKGFGSLFGVTSAKGNIFANDNLVPFAKGGAFTNSIVSSPTVFPFAKGIGLMGEAGPEAIMPLKRGPNGALGIAAHGGGGAASKAAPMKLNVSINLAGANGDATIREISRQAASEGIRAGLAEYDRALPGRLGDISMRAG